MSRRSSSKIEQRILARSITGILVATLALLLPVTAVAAARAPKRIAVVANEGSGIAGAVIGAKVQKVLKQRKVNVSPPAAVASATKRDGVPTADEDWVNLGRHLKVDGFLQLTFSASGAKRRVDVEVRNAADGQPLGSETFSAKGPPKKLAAVVGKSLWKKVGRAVMKTSASGKGKKDAGGGLPAHDLPPSDLQAAKAGAKDDKGAEPTRDDPPSKDKAGSDSGDSKDATEVAAAEGEESEDDDSSPDGRRRRKTADGDSDGDSDADETVAKRADGEEERLPSVDIEADLRFLRRVFAYVPQSSGSYGMNFVPAVGARVNWFPLKNFGLLGQFEFTTGLKSAGVFPTGTSEVLVGPQGRLPLSFGRIGASVGYFRHGFIIQDTPSTTDAERLSLSIPNTVYTGVRIGGSGRFQVTDGILVGVDAAYRLVTNPGTGVGAVRSAQYFPNGKVNVAFDVAAFVGYRLTGMWELRAGLDYRRYRLASLQGPMVQASGGAADQYLAFLVGVAGVLGDK